MIISHRYKFVYFSIPKTGSESCRKMLYPFLDEKVVSKNSVAFGGNAELLNIQEEK